MRRLVNLLAFLRELAREFVFPGRVSRFGPVVMFRRFTRFCPHCGLGSALPEREWRRIEENEEEVPCPGCENLPRLWLRKPLR